ncbi:50S ribosomal protein L25 [Ignavigranum ruoffiae]|uniref:50S ribosomal protein L25 n=1 Tax=Ignavigranum ruoffiae TaxID=89093 RepID=UPI0024ACD14C|nr:50S ribosomal protein L25 [Ignavigranum ruoffiae]
MNLKAVLRNETGSSSAKKARREGQIPVSLYGKEGEASSLLIDKREFVALLKKEGTNAVFDLDFDGKTQKVWIKDFQKAALKDEIYSVDLEAISADQKLEVEVPIVLLNVETVKVGIVELVMNTVLVESKPDAIPHSFEVDVTGLEIGSTLTIADIDVPADVELLDDPEQTIVTVSAPQEVEETETEEEAAEPEVIGETEEETEE